MGKRWKNNKKRARGDHFSGRREDKVRVFVTHPPAAIVCKLCSRWDLSGFFFFSSSISTATRSVKDFVSLSFSVIS